MKNSPGVEASERIGALVLSTFAIGLHAVLFANAGPLWRDEANNASLAAMPWNRLRASIALDSFPALYPCLVRVWTIVFSSSDQSFRLLGCMAGVGLLWAIWSNRRHCGGGVPLLALALVCLNPTVLVWGDSLRAYGLGAGLLAVCFGLFLQISSTPTVNGTILTSIASVLAVQTLYQNILFIAVFAAAAVFVGYRSGRVWTGVAAVIASGLAAGSLLPYVGIFARYREAYVVRQGSVSLWQLMRIFGGAFGNFEVAAVWVLTLAAVLYIAWSRPRHFADDKSDAADYGLAVLALSVPGYLLFLLWMNYSVQSWYFILPITAAALALEVALSARESTGIWRRSRYLAAATAAVFSIILACSQVRVRRTNVDRIAARLAVEAGARDLIVVCPWFEGISFNRYYQGPASWTTIPPLEDHAIHRYDLVKRRMTEADPLAPLLAQVERTLKAGGRIWLAGGLPMHSFGPLPVTRPNPGNAAGWREAAYTEPWGMRFRAAIEAHGLRFILIWAGDKTPVNSFEDMKLWLAEVPRAS